MKLTRRHTLMMAFGSAVAAILPFRAFAAVEDNIQAFTGGADVGSEGITLIAPEIAENGNTVPIEVNAPGAEAIIVLAVAKMADGSFVQASQEVKVTIGGCGG